MMVIPSLINKTFLQIKLRDYPRTEGLPVTNFVFTNTVKVVKPKGTATLANNQVNGSPNNPNNSVNNGGRNPINNPVNNQNPVGLLPIRQPNPIQPINQNNNPKMPNQPGTGNTNPPKPMKKTAPKTKPKKN